MLLNLPTELWRDMLGDWLALFPENEHLHAERRRILNYLDTAVCSHQFRPSLLLMYPRKKSFWNDNLTYSPRLLRWLLARGYLVERFNLKGFYSYDEFDFTNAVVLHIKSGSIEKRMKIVSQCQALTLRHLLCDTDVVDHADTGLLRNLESLQFCGSNTSSDSLAAVGEYCRQLKCLQCQMEHCDGLLSVIPSLAATLTHLDVECRVNNAGLADTIAEHCTSLRKLCLEGPSWNSASLAAVYLVNPQLRFIWIGMGGKSVVKFNGNNDAERFMIYSGLVKQESCLRLIELLPAIHSLVYEKVKVLSMEVLSAHLTVSANTLKALELRECSEIPLTPLRVVLTSCPTLTHFTCFNSSLNNRQVCLLFDSPMALTHLSFSTKPVNKQTEPLSKETVLTMLQACPHLQSCEVRDVDTDSCADEEELDELDWYRSGEKFNADGQFIHCVIKYREYHRRVNEYFKDERSRYYY